MDYGPNPTKFYSNQVQMRSSNKQKYIAFIILYISDPSGWWRGKKTNGEEGLFPGTYVEKM